MICKKCGKIISENSLRCPYCSVAVNEDYFGYHKADNVMRLQAEQPQKKDNSGKIILIILSAVAGLFSILCMLIFAFSGSNSSGYQQTDTFDASFSVFNDFEFFVTDDMGSDYTISISPADTQSGKKPVTQKVSSGEKYDFSFESGSYSVVVMKNLQDMITLNMTVSAASEFTSIEIQYDDRQIMATNGGDVSSNSASSDTFYALTNYKIVNDIENGLVEKIFYEKLSDGYKLTIDSADCDSSVYTVIFDAEKRITSVTSEWIDATAVDEYEYNGDLLISETRKISGTLECAVDYTYDSNGNCIKKVYDYSNGPDMEITYQYDKNGKLTSEESKSTSSSVINYDYDSDGNLVNKSCYTDEMRTLSYVENYSYDSDGNLISHSYEESEMNPYSYKYEYTYNSDGSLKTYSYDNINSSASSFSHDGVYKYDDNSMISAIEFTGDMNGTKTYEYTEMSKEFDGLLEKYIKLTSGLDLIDYYYR